MAAITRLSEIGKVPQDTAKKWLIKQALWQIYLPVQRRIPLPKFDVRAHPQQGAPGCSSFSVEELLIFPRHTEAPLEQLLT